MPKFETLEYDIRKMLEGDHAPESLELRTDTAHRIIKLAKNVATHTLDIVNHKPRLAKSTKDTSIRMSELGEPCHRKLLYKWYTPQNGLHPNAEKGDAFLPVKFTYGDYIEELTLFLAEEAGHQVMHRQQECVLKPDFANGWHAIGHIDAMIDGVVVDVKSAADVSFQKYCREGLTEANDTFGYIWQLDAYATAYDNTARAFIFTNKHDGKLRIIDRTMMDLAPVGDTIRIIGSVADVYIGGGPLPDRMPTKTTKYGMQLGTICSYCAFKYHCYNGDIKAVIASGRPQYFVESTLTKEGKEFVYSKTEIEKPPAYT